ncbi:hypothetical protein [Delftia acidovorans]|uniref:hypothetical protein n=1 Tax=Delftia acidovorans TaxID=80866 RepID=UPI00333FD988
MRIGVVCEGETDYLALKHFLGAELTRRKIDTEFLMLQPTPDRSSGGGWGNVMGWLESNPPAARDVYFSSGLFEELDAKANLNAILIHLDTDILPEESFVGYLKKKGYALSAFNTVDQKAIEISKVIGHFAQFPKLTPEKLSRHIPAPISESSEAWCVAIDGEHVGNAEELTGQDLINAFGAALSRFKKTKPQQEYKKINKNIVQREAYCSGTAANVQNIHTCSLFLSLVNQLVNIKPV